jgi:ribose transport system ATP-binding protein
MADTGETLLRVEGLRKHYGGLWALDGVGFDVRPAEVHAVVGENGAGKSTLMKILGGIVRRDAGTTVFRGRTVDFASPHESIAAGIAIIHQELSVLPTLTVMENVFMGRMPSAGGRVRWREMEARTRRLLAEVGLDIDPRLVINRLSLSQRQLVEIAKALSIEASLLIMDEPNSSLSDAETDRLFGVIRSLKTRGVSVVYVSHKIEEVLEISDRITVLRDGRYVGTVDTQSATVDGVIRMMVGRALAREYVPSAEVGPVLMSVRGLKGHGFRDVSFDLRRGEILCFYGLVGSGRSETMRAIFGADRWESGEILFEGRRARFASPSQAIREGVAMVPEDRKKSSLFPGLPIRMNVGMARLPRLRRGLAIDRGRLNETVAGFVRGLSIKLRSADDAVRSLSGGNQQKTVLARWLATEPKLLILDEPTHGIDVGAKSEIYELIRKLARSGMGIALVSSELPEVLAMADRVVVMCEGAVTGTLERREIDEHRIMSYATGRVPGGALPA